MASQSYYDWLSAGQPYTLARVCKQVQAKLRARGFTVYDYPNDAHLKAVPPEDHTPFSATGFPSTSPRWWAHALDIMPKGSSAAALKEIADLARKIRADRDGGVPGIKWLKYMNWTDENGTCRQENWKSGTRQTYSSSDSGHIHLSSFTGYESSTVADGYDPLATDTGGGIPMTVTDDNVQALYVTEFSGGGAGTTGTKGVVASQYRGSNDTVGNAQVSQLIYLVEAMKDLQGRATATLSDTQLASLRDGIVSALIADNANGLTADDKTAIETIVDRQLDQFGHGAADVGV